MAEIKIPKYVFIEKCVSCGEVIPEGRQVCPNCEKKPIDNEVIGQFTIDFTEGGDNK